jgi:DNA-binding NtrC family response regulator
VRALQRHAWPGNVRELKNVLQRASLLSKGAEVTAADLGLPAGAFRGALRRTSTSRPIEDGARAQQRRRGAGRRPSSGSAGRPCIDAWSAWASADPA